MKQKLTVFALFILLTAAAIWPLPVMELRNEQMMDDIAGYAADGTIYGSDVETEVKMDIDERISLISSGAVEVWSSDYMDVENSSGMGETLESQIKLLQDLRALPQFELAESSQMVYGQRMFMHPEDPEKLVNIWRVRAKYRDVDVYAYIDAELSAVYDIVVIAENGGLTYDKDTAPQGFIKYLASFSQSGALENMPDIFCTYDKDKAYLGFISQGVYDKQVKIAVSENYTVR